MNQQGMKLTAYFGERQRAIINGSRSQFLADAMLDLFGAHEIATSVMLRGIASFGLDGVWHSDESLSLSEDPPVAVAAVDTEPKIHALTNKVSAMTERGLVTLETARLVSGSGSTTNFDDADSAEATKLTVFVGRQERIGGVRAHYAVCNLLYRHGFAGASAFLGVDGTAHGERYRAGFFSRNVNVPMMIVAVGTAKQAAAATTELAAAMPTALLTIERVRLCKQDGIVFARPEQFPATDNHGQALWQKIMVHTSEATRHDGLPIHRALIRRLRQSHAAHAVTALRGIWGFHGDHQPHGDKLFHWARRVPVTTIIVDTPDSLARSFDVIDELTTHHGLVTSELVPTVLPIDQQHKHGDTG
ncbi:MAG: DUF190 domain-containing protein [Mycobacteriaceae bacterium]|nr:DUF190 domain-containing protein [Mycobacteriaceae bacterium]